MSTPTQRPVNVVLPATPQERPDIAMYVFFAMMVVLGVDLSLDIAHSSDAKHLLTDGAATVMAAGGSVLGWRVYRKEKRARAEREANEGQQGKQWQAQAAAWRAANQPLVSAFAGAVDTQLADWQLGPDQNRVARLLIAGLTVAEIAPIIGVSLGSVERIERDVYAKADVPGRHELRALFLAPALGIEAEQLLPGAGQEPA